jgi:diguanylate cyclase (GGDEF)-like protein
LTNTAPKNFGISDYRFWLERIVARPWLTIALILCFTVIMAVRLPSLTVNATSYEVVVPDLESVAVYEAFLEEFGGGEYIQIIAKGKNVFDPEIFSQLEVMAQKLSQVPGVSKVISLPGIKQDMDLLDEWSLAQFEEIVTPVTLFHRNVFSSDKKSTAFTMLLDDIRQEEAIVAAVEWILKNHSGDLEVYQIGMPLVSQALLNSIKRDFSLLPPITFAVMVLTLIFLFGSIRLVIAPVSCVLVTLIWTFGVMAWTDTPVSAMTLVVPIFLMTVGTAYCLHVVSEYVHLARTATDSKEAAAFTLRHMRLPTALAVGTTLVGLSALVFNSNQTILDFAIPACVGMLSFMLLLFTLFPAILALMPLMHPKNAPRSGDILDRLLKFVVRVNLNHQKALFTVAAILTILGLWGISQLRIDADTTRYFRESEPVTQHFHDVYQDMAGAFPVNVVVGGPTADYFSDPDNIAKLLELQDYLESIPGIDKTLSFANYVQLIYYSINNYIPTFYALPQDPAELGNILNLYKMFLGPDMSRRFMNEDRSKAAILMMMHISSGYEWLETEAQILEWSRQFYGDTATVQMASMGTIVAHSNRVITKNLLESMSVVLVLVLLMMLALFVSVKAGFVTLIPNCFPLIVVFGVMGWADIELSMNTVMIASIAIGLALDDAIHYMVRYNREFRKDLDRRRALADSVRTVGRPIVLTSITLVLGFFILTFSTFTPTATFGALMMLTMTMALIGDIFLLPALMTHVELVTAWDLLNVRIGRDQARRIPLFNGMGRMQIRALLAAGSLHRMEPGQMLFPDDDHDQYLFAVISGEVAQYRHSDIERPEHDRVRVATLRAGDVIGGLGSGCQISEGCIYMASTTADLLAISPRSIKRLQWLYPPTAYRFVNNLMSILTQRLVKATQNLAENGFRDDVTGVLSPLTFVQALENEVARCVRHQGKLTLALVEATNLDSINQKHGFSAGDRILAQMTVMLQNNLRRYDTACRLTSRCFALLLVESDAKEALILRRRCESLFERMNQDDMEVDIRIGFAVFDSLYPVSAQELMEKARQDMESEPT